MKTFRSFCRALLMVLVSLMIAYLAFASILRWTFVLHA